MSKVEAVTQDLYFKKNCFKRPENFRSHILRLSNGQTDEVQIFFADLRAPLVLTVRTFGGI